MVAAAVAEGGALVFGALQPLLAARSREAGGSTLSPTRVLPSLSHSRTVAPAGPEGAKGGRGGGNRGGWTVARGGWQWNLWGLRKKGRSGELGGWMAAAFGAVGVAFCCLEDKVVVPPHYPCPPPT